MIQQVKERKLADDLIIRKYDSEMYTFMLTFDNTKVTSIHSDTKIYLAPDLFISTDVLKSDKIDESMIGFDYNHILSNVSESEKLINNIKYVTTFVKDELIPFLEKLN